MSLVVLGLCAAVLWPAYPLLGLRSWVNLWDSYHYFLGAKYNSELRYDGLYECATLADAENGHAAELPLRRFRNLRTNRLEPAATVLADRPLCRERFSNTRWHEFRGDVEVFRQQATRAGDGLWNWALMQADHGFNASPLWVAVARPFVSSQVPTPERLALLSLLDITLLVFMWRFVGREFGWPSLAVALLFWGTNDPARFGWTAGSILRQDWLAAIVIAICLLRRNRFLLSGMLLAYASLTRIFPTLVLLALVLGYLGSLWQHRRRQPSRPLLLCLTGAVIGTIVLGLLAAISSGRGLDVWQEFYENSRKHVATPLSNNLGLNSLLSWQSKTSLEQLETEVPPSRPGEHFQRLQVIEESWIDARRGVLKSRRTMSLIALAGFIIFMTTAMRMRPWWIAGILGIALLPWTGDLTCYYYGVFLVFGFLFPIWPVSGIILCAAACATRLGNLFIGSAEIQTLLNSGVVLSTALAVVLITLIGRSRDPDLGPDSKPA